MAVSAKVVMALRQASGLPMMDCKKALEEANGDLEAAKEILRKQGQKVMAKKSDRQVKELRVDGFVSPDGKTGVLLAMYCETEPVARCEDLVGFQEDILDVLQKAPTLPDSKEALMAVALASGQTVTEKLEEIVGKIRENILVGDYAVITGDSVAQYIHFDNRHGAMTALTGADSSDASVLELGKNLCMHVVFSKPRFLNRDNVPAEEAEKEKGYLLAAMENDPKHANKPDSIKEKIVTGQMGRFFSENCFLEQPFIKDDKVKVGDQVTKTCKGAELSNYVYMGLTK